MTAKGCSHIAGIKDVTPSALGCEECLKSGSPWLHLRICRTCGHVGCCDDSPNKHATAHFHATGHPVIEGYDPPEGWGWCFIDKVLFDLSKRQTPQKGRSRAITELDRRCPGCDSAAAHQASHCDIFRKARTWLICAKPSLAHVEICFDPF